MSGHDPPNILAIQGLEDPNVNEFLAHPDRRQISAFFLGWVFISSLNYIVHSSFLRHFLQRIRERRVPSQHDTESFSEKRSLSETSNNSSLFRNDNNTLIFALSLCFAFSSVAYFSSLLTFAPNGGAGACAFFIAWGGMAGETARLLGIWVLSFELKGLGVHHWESVTFWAVLGIGTVTVFVNNGISIGALRFVQQLGVSLCYREHFLPTSLVSSLIRLLMEFYAILRLWRCVAPPFLQFRHQITSLKDIRMMRACSLLLLDLLTIVPSAIFTNVLAEFIPFSIGVLCVLAAFNHQVAAPIEIHVTSIPPTVSDSRSPCPSGPTPGTPIRIHDHPYSGSSLEDSTDQDGEWLSPIQTARSSRTVDSITARSVKNAVVQVASRYPRLPLRTIDGLLPASPPTTQKDAEKPSQADSLTNDGLTYRIMPSQAAYAQRFEADPSALAPRRPPVTIVATRLESRPPPSPNNSDGDMARSKSSVSSVVYGSDVLRRSTMVDPTKRHSIPPSFASPTSPSRSHSIPSSRDSFVGSPTWDPRRFSAATAYTIRTLPEELPVVHEGSGRESVWSKKKSRRPTFGEGSFAQMGGNLSFGSLYRSERNSPSSLRFSTVPPIPPLNLPASPPAVQGPLPSSGLSSSLLTPSGESPPTSRDQKRFGVIRGPRPPPRSYNSSERTLLSPESPESPRGVSYMDLR